MYTEEDPEPELDAIPLELELELEAEVVLPEDLTKVPPIGVPGGGKVEEVALLAFKVKAARVFPVLGALMAATIPAWQWLPTV